MKTIVIYFSQTGNTETIAHAIQRGVVEATGQCDLAEIREVSPLELGEYDLIGLGSPVMGAEPANVAEFVKQMRFVGGKHIFLFYTHGTNEGVYWPSIYPKLKARGLVVIGKADWYGDCHLLHMPQPYPTLGHPDEIDIEEAEKYGWEMAVRSMRISKGETDLIPEAPALLPPPKPRTGDGKSIMELIGSFGSMLKYDKEKCLYPQCTLCMDECPTYGNDVTVEPPVFGEPCLGCEFCVRICPTGALDMTEWIEQMFEASKLHLPGMVPNLDKAEQEGRFRRYIPMDDVDFETPGFRTHTGHPQWIIGVGPQRDKDK